MQLSPWRLTRALNLRLHPGELRLIAGHAAGRVPAAAATSTHLTGAAGARAGRVTFIRPRREGAG